MRRATCAAQHAPNRACRFEARMHAAEHTLLVQSIAKLTSH
jgi:hypothetical protein